MYDILHIRDYYPSPENPASSPWVYDQVRAVQDFGLKPLVISPTPYVPAFLRSRGRFYLYPRWHFNVKTWEQTDVIRPMYLKLPTQSATALNLYNLSRSITKSLPRSVSPSLIHAHFGQNGFAALNLKQKLKVPLVTSFYGYDVGRLGSKFSFFYQKLIPAGERFLVLSTDMQNDLLALGFPAERIRIHHLGIDLDQFSLKPRSEDGKFIFLIVARLVKSKGAQDVIRAFHRIRKPDQQLRIVGDGIFKANLEALAGSLGLQDQVRFINNFKTDNPRQVVIDEMQRCDVAMLTSFSPPNGAKEGTPVVLMEAQACGKPCISTIHAGIPEVVIDTVSGFLVKERDIDGIAERMQQFYCNRDLVRQMGMQGRKHVEEEYNQQIQMKRLVELYRELGSA